MRISDWSSDVGSSDLLDARRVRIGEGVAHADAVERVLRHAIDLLGRRDPHHVVDGRHDVVDMVELRTRLRIRLDLLRPRNRQWCTRSEEHTSELQSLMRNSYAVFCLKKNE